MILFCFLDLEVLLFIGYFVFFFKEITYSWVGRLGRRSGGLGGGEGCCQNIFVFENCIK